METLLKRCFDESWSISPPALPVSTSSVDVTLFVTFWKLKENSTQEWSFGIYFISPLLIWSQNRFSTFPLHMRRSVYRIFHSHNACKDVIIIITPISTLRFACPILCEQISHLLFKFGFCCVCVYIVCTVWYHRHKSPGQRVLFLLNNDVYWFIMLAHFNASCWNMAGFPKLTKKVNVGECCG